MIFGYTLPMYYYFNDLNHKELQHQRVVTCSLFLAYFHVHLHFNLVNFIISGVSFSSLFPSSFTFQSSKFTFSSSRNSKLKRPLK